MWLSRQQKRETEERAVATGPVTISGERVSVELDSERRDLIIYGPGGYRWRPKTGEQVLVVRTDEGLCVVGTPCTCGLDAGEAGLAAPGGAEVTVKRDGHVLLSGAVEVNGELRVQGEVLEDLVRRIAAEVVNAIPG